MNIKINAFVRLLMLAALSGQALAEGGIPNSVREQLRLQFPSTTIDDVRETPFPGIYEVTAGKNILYALPGTPLVMLGHLYDTSRNVDLTQARLDELRTVRVAWEDLPLEDAIRHGDGRVKIAIFTDLDCPYCRQLEQELANIDDIEVHRFLFPLASIHPKATDRSRQILCSSNPAKAYLDYVLAQQEPKGKKECGKAATIERNLALGEKLGFRGTPVLVRQDGAILMGYRPLATLKKWLEQGDAETREARK